MSAQLRHVWFTEHGSRLVMMSVEVNNPAPEAPAPHCTEMSFPAEPSPEHPLRRVMKMGILNEDDLCMIRDAINEYLEES